VEADLAEVSPGVYSVLLGGQSCEVRVAPFLGGGLLTIQSGAEEFTAEVFDARTRRRPDVSGRGQGLPDVGGPQQVCVPMPGRVIRIQVREGDRVEVGQVLFVVEAMKMLNEIRSPKGGVVEHLLVAVGRAVNAGEPLALISGC
jgi:pyruvate carboxylase subunit B